MQFWLVVLCSVYVALSGRLLTGEGAEALPEFGKWPTKGTDGPKPTDSESAVDLKDGAGKAEDEPGSGEAGISGFFLFALLFCSKLNSHLVQIQATRNRTPWC